jgi:hypothetical protein
MIAYRINKTLLALAAIMIATLAASSAAVAAERPVKEILETHIGWDVNNTKVKAGSPQPERDLCTVSSKEECQRGETTHEPGGFEYPIGVAAGPAPSRDVYVTDRSNNRVEVFTPQGTLLSTFGEGLLAEPMSIAVGQASGDVYVLDWAHHRVVESAATGEFVLMIGGEVNETQDDTPGATEAQKNLCTEEEVKTLAVKCETGVESAVGAKSHGAFRLERERGDLLAVGPGGVLYVGDEGRVQEFEGNGAYKGEISVVGRVEALAVDAAGDVYLTSGGEDAESATVIHKFTAAGVEVKDGQWPFKLEPKPNTEEGTVNNPLLSGLAVDPAGRVATIGIFDEFNPSTGVTEARTFGLLLDGMTAELVTEFKAGPTTKANFTPSLPGIAFSETETPGTGGFEMYVAGETEQQVLGYVPVPVAELTTNPVTDPTSCLAGAERETDATFNCTLSGEVNPWGVLDTDFWFEWGNSNGLGEMTPKQVLCTTVCASTPSEATGMIEGVRPDEALVYRVAAEDASVVAPEVLQGGVVSFDTGIVAPRVLGVPAVSFVHASSAVLFGEVNPENAKTAYFFEYGPCPTTQACPTSAFPLRTAALESATYGPIETVVEATGLQPSTIYHYRLTAESENTTKTEKQASTGQGPQVGVFETAPAPAPQAVTGSYSALGDASAVISGSVNPDGQPATYTFELGVYNGAATEYGVVFSGALPPSTVLLPESLVLTGLQAGTQYAYRILVKSGYGESIGSMMTFTTLGLPAVLTLPSVLAQLPVPNVAFPEEQPGKVTSKALTRAQKLTLALKACTKQPRDKRAVCVRSARKKYAVAKTNAKKKRR